MNQELSLGTVVAKRKRGQRPCSIGISLADAPDEIVVRTADVSGVGPIVMVLSPEAATNLIDLLKKAVAAKTGGVA